MHSVRLAWARLLEASHVPAGRAFCSQPPELLKTSSIIHEMRSYTIRVDQVPAYLKASSGRLFETRLAASRCLGFFMVETGGDINRFVHLWEYEDMEQRRRVRQGLSENGVFQDYWRTVRPLIRTQTSQILEPVVPLFSPQSLRDGIFALQCLPSSHKNACIDEGDPDADGLRLVGSWTELWGKDCGRFWRLFRSSDGYGPLVRNQELIAPAGGKTSIITPTEFSPMQ